MTRNWHNLLSRIRSAAMYGLCIGFTLLILLLLGLVLGYLIWLGASSLSWGFFTELPTGRPDSPGGMRHAIQGTLILIGLAGTVGIPLGMMAGIYLSEFSSEWWLAGSVQFIADVLAGVPSIVVGMLGYELIVVPIGHYNGWAGALALAFIMVPIVARTTQEMLQLVPRSYREASIALGATRAATIVRVVLPAATGSIVTGIMLALARVAGETAPLLFTALGSRLLTTNPNEPFPSLTVQIFNYATSPYAQQKNLAWAGILVLVALIMVLNLTVSYVAHWTQRRTTGSGR